MMTICWDGHKFEYLQDQTTCNTKGCGEYPQFRPRRFAPGEREKLEEILKGAETKRLNNYDLGYDKGFMEGFEKGMLAEEARVK